MTNSISYYLLAFVLLNSIYLFSQSSQNESDSTNVEAHFLRVLSNDDSYEIISGSDSISLTRKGFFQDKILFETDSILIIENWIYQEYIPLSFFNIYYLNENDRLVQQTFSNLVITDSSMHVEPISVKFEEDTCHFQYGFNRQPLESINNFNLNVLLRRFKYYLEEG